MHFYVKKSFLTWIGQYKEGDGGRESAQNTQRVNIHIRSTLVPLIHELVPILDR